MKRTAPGPSPDRCPLCSIVHRPNCPGLARRWALEPLLAASRLPLPELARRVCMAVSRIEGMAEVGLDDRTADRWAIKLGLHPGLVWPDWFDAALTVRDRRFVEGNGWRDRWLADPENRTPAWWEHQEHNVTEQSKEQAA